MMELDESTLTPAFAALLRSRNLAADDALVAAFPHLEGERQVQALAILLARDHDAALGGIVAYYATGDDALRAQLRAHADALSAGARICMASEDFEHRRAAIELIRTSRSGKLAYLLAEALRHHCRKTVQLAAEALAELADLAGVGAADVASARAPQARGSMTYVGAALRTALAAWPLHLRPEVVAAAVRLAGPLEDAVLAAADDPRSNIARAFGNVITGSHDPRIAGFCLRSLRSQSLRTAAAAVLADARTPEFRAALADEAWLLADAEVRKSCARARGIASLREEADVLAEAQHGRGRAAVRLIAAAGGRPQGRLGLLRKLSINKDPATSRAALWALIEDRSEEATEALNTLSARGDVPLASILRLDLRRRTYGTLGARGPLAPRPANGDGEPINAFEPYWTAFDTLPEDARVNIGRTVVAGVPEFAVLMREKWNGGSDEDRLRFLKIVQTLGDAPTFAEELYAAARDPGSHIRSLAVGLLAGVHTAASRRLLRDALDDPDDRVQANAIEAIERLGGREETVRVMEKLQATDSRVRANAVKALVHLGMREGARTLIEMLASDTPSDRISALWVVERMRLQHMLQRIERIVAADPDERVRTRARRLLRKFNERSAVLASRGAAKVGS
ncbi:MAG TPA: HEAT repeat domain-containing protein [Phycisphaerae bacterium]|nr:HEAT repeat domain-containing protein [Phycisphaerae bacterium]